MPKNNSLLYIFFKFYIFDNALFTIPFVIKSILCKCYNHSPFFVINNSHGGNWKHNSPRNSNRSHHNIRCCENNRNRLNRRGNAVPFPHNPLWYIPDIDLQAGWLPGSVPPACDGRVHGHVPMPEPQKAPLPKRLPYLLP